MLQRWPVMQRACSCYICGQFNAGSMVTLLKRQFNGERMVMLRR